VGWGGKEKKAKADFRGRGSGSDDNQL